MGPFSTAIQGQLLPLQRAGLRFLLRDNPPDDSPTLIIQVDNTFRFMTLFDAKRTINYLLREKVVANVECYAGKRRVRSNLWLPFSSDSKPSDAPMSQPSLAPPVPVFHPSEEALIRAIQESENPGFIVHQASDDAIIASDAITQVAGRSKLFCLSPTGRNMKQYLSREDHYQIFQKRLMQEGVIEDAVYEGSIWEAWVNQNGTLIQVPLEEANGLTEVEWKRSPRLYRAKRIELLEIGGDLYRVTTGVELVE